VLTLADGALTASVLDPACDGERLGSRYCSGGYVWQVTDATHGDVFAGPCFPAAEPAPFDGQGAPEVFEIALGQHEAALGDEVYVIGVGRVRRESPVRPFHVRDNPTVTERAVWDIATLGPNSLRFRTHALFGDFALELVRSLELRSSGRTLASSTLVTNLGTRALPLRWFAHPFFPWPGERVCRLSLEHVLPDGAALVTDASGFVTRRAESDWSRGHYLLPRVALGGELTVEQCHPTLGFVRVRCGFPLGGLALWGNERTFSFEPFFQSILEPGAETRFGLSYEFGAGGPA
jgi:hypothetical protein